MAFVLVAFMACPLPNIRVNTEALQRAGYAGRQAAQVRSYQCLIEEIEVFLLYESFLL
jgi:hypothetical protein